MVMSVEETFPILDDVVLPPAKGRAARPRKSDLDTIQKEKRAFLAAKNIVVKDAIKTFFSSDAGGGTGRAQASTLSALYGRKAM
jgi:hypothetical protein